MRKILFIISCFTLLSCVSQNTTNNKNYSLAPALNHPLDGSVQFQTIPYFDRDDVIKEQPYPGLYIIEIAEDKSFNTAIDVDTVPALISHYSTNFELEYGKTYFWRVAYINKTDRYCEPFLKT